jgi:hypothetical protein
VASVGAALVVAVAQGILGGLAFRIVGLGAPAFWGLVMGSPRSCRSWGNAVGPAGIGLVLAGRSGAASSCC